MQDRSQPIRRFSPQHVTLTRRRPDLEAAIVRHLPPLDHSLDLDHPIPEPEPPRGLLAAGAGVALDANCEGVAHLPSVRCRCSIDDGDTDTSCDAY